MGASKRPRLTGARARSVSRREPAARALTPRCPAEPASAQLGLLSEPLQALLVPHLRLADVQRLGQACKATRDLVHALPEAALRRLAQARVLGTCCLCTPQLALMSCAQEDQLPVPEGRMRRQLDLWASQVAAVRTGNLQLSCELGGLATDADDARLSPHADWLAALHPCREGGAMLFPVNGTRVEVGISAWPRSRTLSAPGREPGLLWQLLWSPAGQHLVFVSYEHAGRPYSSVRVSTFCGTQLVASFAEPLADQENYRSLHMSDDADSMLLTVAVPGAVRVLACTAQGTVTARHPEASTADSTAPLRGGRILRASSDGDRLYIYSATCVQEIALQPGLDAGWSAVEVSAWSDQASVLLVGLDCPLLFLVDLEQLHVRCLVELPGYAISGIVQGARAVVLDPQQASAALAVVTASGTDLGSELFRCLGRDPVWDPMGMFLAMFTEQHGVCILDGATGAVLASWPGPGLRSGLRWLPDSSGLVFEVMEEVSGSDSDADSGSPDLSTVSWCVLRFGSAMQPAS